MGHHTTTIWSREEAYRYCQRLAQTHYENFTVGSWLLPSEQRRHVYAIYGYCRGVDDLGDETIPSPSMGEGQVRWRSHPDSDAVGDGGAPPHPSTSSGQALSALTPGGRRMLLLDWWQGELEACYSGRPSHPVMVALQETIGTFDIPPEPFLKLIEANRMDQKVQRRPSYAQLLHYCDHSANPVGHLYLYLFGYRDQERQRLADCTCTALQMANFWQDVARDYRMGRVYLPLEDMARFGYTEEELAQGVVNDAFRQLMAFEVDRAMALFRQGEALVEMLDGMVRLHVALFTQGGVAILKAIQRQGYDVLSSRPALSRTHKARLLLSTWTKWKLGLGLDATTHFKTLTPPTLSRAPTLSRVPDRVGISTAVPSDLGPLSQVKGEGEEFCVGGHPKSPARGGSPPLDSPQG